MRLARTWAPLAAAAVSITCLFAAPAAATDEVEVVDESTGQLCRSLPTGCAIHLVGELELVVSIFMFEVHEGDCRVELDAAIGGDGAIRITGLEELEDTAGTHDANCLHGPVETPASLPWQGDGEETAPGEMTAAVNVSLDPTEAATCSGELAFRFAEGSGSPMNQEEYEAVFDHSRVGSSACWLSGRLAPEGADGFHINHATDPPSEDVSFVSESTGQLCPPLPTGCETHLTGEIETTALIFGFEVHEGDCPVELGARYSGGGAVRITDYEELEDTAGTHDANCLHGPVVSPENLPWTGYVERISGVEVLTIPMDLDPTESAECSGNVEVSLAEGVDPEDQAAVFDNEQIGSSVCKLTGVLAQEGGIHVLDGPPEPHEPVTVVNEATGTACPALPTGCPAHFTGELALSTIIFGLETFEFGCRVELDMSISGSANAFVTSFNEIEDTAGIHSDNCLHGPIMVAESLPWAGSGEEVEPGVVEMAMAIDLDPTETGECTGIVEVRIADTGAAGAERYAVTFPSHTRVGSSVCLLEGTLTQERSETIHINHQ